MVLERTDVDSATAPLVAVWLLDRLGDLRTTADVRVLGADEVSLSVAPAARSALLDLLAESRLAGWRQREPLP